MSVVPHHLVLCALAGALATVHVAHADAPPEPATPGSSADATAVPDATDASAVPDASAGSDGSKGPATTPDASAGSGGSTGPATADAPPESASPAAPTSRLQLAVGFNLGWQERYDYGNGTRSNIVPELVALGYLKTGTPRLYLRPGARLGYSGLDQPDYPKGIAFREDEAMLSGELGVVYDGLFIPSATAGVGLHYRHSSAESTIATVDTSPLGGSEVQPFIYGQFGAGLSFLSGLLVAEPFVRYEWLRRDSRIAWRYGVELTVQLF